jgi:molecular chaperone DnaJ
VVERTLTVDVPAGVDNGSTLRLGGHGPAGYRGGPNGALFVHLSVNEDDVFERDGTDLHADLHVAMTQATLGATVGFETLDDHRDVVIAPGTQTGQVVRMKGLGVPHVRGRGRGDLYVRVVVETPTDLDAAQRELVEHLAIERGEAVDPPGPEKLFSKIRSALS